ncbi:MAG: DEAD/DEAH box helicase family protein [Akkermansiaceae bacterium]|nr:DEAD/DEAH box helicase family protein [Akkermansiaceae bacterium]
MVLIPKSVKKEIHRIMPACYIFQSQFHAEKEFTPSSSRMSPLQKILENYRANSKTEREKGTYFEKLTQAYLEKDDIQRQEFSRVWTYAEWAKSQGISKSDTGIDLVAEMADGSGVCAIQCKFYAADYAVQKSDIDSFFTASGKKPFARRIIIDSTEVEYSKNALDALHGQQIPTSRIGLHQISESRIDWDKFLSSEKVSFRAKKSPRQHQQEALTAVREGFTSADRGKLIMACGTGKTYTALHIAEQLFQKEKPGSFILFLVPSLALMQQTITEWKNDSSADFTAFAACSDTQVGVRKRAKTSPNWRRMISSFQPPPVPKSLRKKFFPTARRK